MRIYNFAYDWAPRVEALTRQLVSVPSVVDSAGEAACARAIYHELACLPYFQTNPDHLLLQRTQDDACERYSVIALVRGAHAPVDAAATHVLMGHLDTVDIQDYAPHVDLACNPDELARITGAAAGYLVGRGALDMKSGLAAHLAVLERFASGAGDQTQALLFAATPDEEGTAKGILSFVAALPDLAARWRLDVRGAINTDYIAPRYPGDSARTIYTGTIGKLLPALLVAGRETHVGEPFSGFDPNWLVAEVVRRVDYNPALCDTAHGEVTPPPVALKMTDLKPSYTVQTALHSWAYFNWFTLQHSCGAVLAQFQSVVAAAFADLQGEFQARALRYAALRAEPAPATDWTPAVYTYAELSARVAERLGPDFESATAARLAQDPSLDLRTFSCRLTEELLRVSGLPTPVAVVGYAQIYSPPVHLDHAAPLSRAVARAAEAVAAETGLELPLGHYFPYISDMSFLGCPESADGLATLAANSPGWGRLYRVDHAGHARLNLPVVNIGPWGEGAHTRHERVEKSYAFGVVPELIWRTLWG